MIYLNIKLEDFLKIHPLKLMDYICPKCGQKFETIIPVITKDLAGLETPTHNCGPNYKKVILTPRTPESKQEWQTIIESLTGGPNERN